VNNTNIGALARVATSIEEKTPIHKIAEEFPTTFMKHYRGIERLVHLTQGQHAQSKMRTVRCKVYYGPTGTGKSKRATYEALQLMGGEQPYRKEPKTIWWDGYWGQKVIILDDVDPDDIQPHNRMLRILDRYPLLLQTKGGHVWANWEHVFITSNHHPMLWYPRKVYDQHSPLHDRLEVRNGSSIEEMKGPAVWLNPGEELMQGLEEAPEELNQLILL
jgi:hypothetical protein